MLQLVSHQTLVSALLSAALVCLPVLASAQSNFAASELKRDNNFEPLLLEDMNGDGLKDAVYSEFRPGVGRELLIHMQQANGSFEASPLRVEIKTEIIAVGFADLRPDPGQELVLLANNGVFSLNPRQPGYAGNLKQLLSWDLVASMPNLERVQYFDAIEDINGDGLADLILPGIDQYGIFLGAGNEQFVLLNTLSTINEATAAMERSSARTEFDANVGINPVDGVVLEVSASRRTAFSNFIDQWQDTPTDKPLLESEQWMPALITAHLNDDALLDIAYINVGEDGLGQLNLHLQRGDGGFQREPDWIGSIDTRGSIRLVDINHDKRIDLIHLRGDGDEWDVRMYVNSGGSFNLQKPDQVMRFSGYDVQLNFIQLNKDSTPLLNVSYYTIPVVDAIRNASINRIQLLYGTQQAEPGQLYNRRPDSRLEESFSAANVRGLSEQMTLRYDIDGDGVRDALYITENGTLAAKKISAQLQIADKPFWEYVSNRTVFQFEVLQLNADTAPDVLLRHGTSTTLLVARP